LNRISTTALAALAFAALGASPALAGDKIVLLDLDCDLATGCRFAGNDTSADGIIDAFADHQPSATLDLAFSQKFEFTGSVYSGSWTGVTPISFYSVKAGNEFMLYQLAQAATTGAWSTAGLVNNKGVAHAVSHISLWTGPAVPIPPTIIDDGDDGGFGGFHAQVPEPATWLSLILGFGAIGAALRRRRALATA
jgi:hypothetical protein